MRLIILITVTCLAKLSLSSKPPPKGQQSSSSSSSGCGGSTSPDCTTLPCAANYLNDAGCTTVGGSNPTGTSKTTIGICENIYGPFEAGFTSQQDGILAGLGCATGKGYLAGGIDTLTAEARVNVDCGLTGDKELPRKDGSDYISLLDECGGHTNEYHFHERLSCLYEETGTHSTRVGEGTLEGHFLYGKWEDYSKTQLPNLDVCGGHFGFTPDSPKKRVYHYHVQMIPPFTWGMFSIFTTISFFFW